MRDSAVAALVCALLALAACSESLSPSDAGTGAGGKGGSGGKGSSSGSDMCKARAEQASEAVQAAADKADSSCAADADCEVVSNSTDCHASCGVLVSVRGKSAVQAAIDTLDEVLCKDYEADGCKVLIPPCEPPGAFGCLGGRCRWRDSTTDDAGVQPQPDAAVQGDAGSTAGCLTRAVTFGPNGGLVARIDQFAITPCREFAMSRMELRGAGDSVACKNEIAASAATSVADVNAALAHSDVADAIALGSVLFGVDSRPSDGQVFRIEIGKAVIEVGGACSPGGAGCGSIPPGIDALRATLTALAEQQMKLPTCDAVP